MVRNKIKALALLSLASILAFGFAFSGKSLATVPGVNEAVTPSVTGGSPNGGVSSLSISQDGRYVAFQSNATNLVSSPVVSGANMQVYVRDRYTDTTQLVSVSITGTVGNSWSQGATISADGQYVTFESPATNLTSTSTGGTTEVYVRNLINQTTTLVSSTPSGAAANGASSYGRPDATGQYIVFRSSATNLVSGVSPAPDAIFLKNMDTQAVTLVSKDSSGAVANSNTAEPHISCEGRFIIFYSQASNLPNQSNNVWNLYLVDMLNSGSITNLTPNVPLGTSFGASSITCNGNYVGFNTDANNLTSGDTNGQVDGFVYDRTTGQTELISKSSSGTQANGLSGDVSLSNDGRFAVFNSSATNLVSGDTNGFDDVFLHDRLTGNTELVSKDSSGTQANGLSAFPVISSNARYIAYSDTASNLISGYSNSNFAGFVAETGINDGY